MIKISYWDGNVGYSWILKMSWIVGTIGICTKKITTGNYIDGNAVTTILKLLPVKHKHLHLLGERQLWSVLPALGSWTLWGTWSTTGRTWRSGTGRVTPPSGAPSGSRGRTWWPTWCQGGRGSSTRTMTSPAPCSWLVRLPYWRRVARGLPVTWWCMVLTWSIRTLHSGIYLSI